MQSMLVDALCFSFGGGVVMPDSRTEPVLKLGPQSINRIQQNQFSNWCPSLRTFHELIFLNVDGAVSYNFVGLVSGDGHPSSITHHNRRHP
jgi:hypothetical protein